MEIKEEKDGGTIPETQVIDTWVSKRPGKV